MKLRVKLYRAVELHTSIAKGVLGLKPDELAANCDVYLKDQFGPLAPRIKIVWPDSGSIKTIAGAEMIAFDVPRVGVPSSGIVLGDPLVSSEVSEAEGALRSELARYGVFLEPDQKFEWRLYYEVEGN
jgi:hypothetical protein